MDQSLDEPSKTAMIESRLVSANVGASQWMLSEATGVSCMVIKCPKGHWYDPGASDGTGRCPQCATQTQGETSVSDDDVLAIMNLPDESGDAKSPSEDSKKASSGSGIMRRKKVCPECSHEASYSFVYCPRCGAPLKLVSFDLPKP
jgi:uncharacterized OB-fold protein